MVGSKGKVLGAFGSDFGSFFVSRGDFGIIVELLWVYVGPFSKNTYFPPLILMILESDLATLR